MRNCLIIILSLLLPVSGFAGTLKGRVTDSRGVAIPFVPVYIQGTTMGTTANANGEYLLQLDPGTYKIVCQYIGYKQSVYNVSITGSETMQHNFTLQEQQMELKGVTIKATDEDPAYKIIRKVIARRSFHLKQIKSFQTGIYLKGVLRTRTAPTKILGQEVSAGDMGLDSQGKGVLYLCEEVADYYAAEPDKRRTVVHSVRQSGDPNGLGFAQFPPVISFYENNMNISPQLNPRGFISPVSDNALSYYRYKLMGEFKENGKLISKIQVTPKRDYEPTFRGDIYIVNDDWAIHSVNMMLTKRSNLDMLDSFRIEQFFLPLREDTWVVKSQVLYPVIAIFGFGITGNFVTVYDRQKVNEPIPDSIFGDRIVSMYDKTANKKDTTYWSGTRPIPLEHDEVRDYVVKDSIRRRLEDPAYIDSMRMQGNRPSVMKIALTDYTHTGKGKKSSWAVNPLLTTVSFNTVEGLTLAPRLWLNFMTDTGKTWQVKLAPRYGFSNGHFNTMAGISYTQNDRQWQTRSWTLGAEGGQYVFQFNPDNPVTPLYNTISSLFYRHNYMKIYERRTAALYAKQNFGNGLNWEAKLSYQHRMPLENTTDYNWASPENQPYTDNLPAELKHYGWFTQDAALVSLSVSYQPGFTYSLYPDYKSPNGSNWPVFTLSYKKGIPDLLGSNVDYDKWRFNIADELRLRMLGSVSYSVSAGGFLNDKSVGLPDLMHPYGNQVIMASPYLQSFQLAPYYRFSNTKNLYGEAHVEYYLKGLLTNKIPLLRQARWYFVLGNNTFYAGRDFYHTEVFAGIDNLGWKIVRFLRLDYVHSWDSYNNQYNGLRIGVRPNALINLRFDDADGGEW